MTDSTFQKEQEQLLDDVREVLNSTEDLMNSVGDEVPGKAQELRKRLVANLELAKSKLHTAENAVVHRAKCAAGATDQYVNDNPWKSMGVAAGVGLLLGLLISRK